MIHIIKHILLFWRIKWS